MTGSVDDLPDGAAPMAPGMRTRVGEATRTLLGPLWTTTFRDPVRTGRLRLDGLSGPERQLAKAGLVTLVLLLGSLLFVDAWRSGTLLHLAIATEPRFVPEGLLPVTLVALYLGLLLVVWGALDAAPSVRLVVAFLYAAAVGSLGAPATFEVSDAWILRHGDTVVRVAFWVPVAALVLSALVSRVRSLARWTTPVLRTLCLLAFAAMAVAQLWMHVEFTDEGFQGAIQSLVHSGFTSIDGLLIPLVFLAALAVIDFATDVSTSLAEPVGRASARWLNVVRGLLVTLLAVKLWVELVAERDYWAAYLLRQQQAVVFTVGVLAFLAAVTWAVSRLAPAGTESDVDEAKERLVLGGAILLAASVLVGVLLIGLGELVLATFRQTWAAEAADLYPVSGMSQAVPILGSLLAIVAGIVLVRRGWARLEPGYSRELGCGLVVVGAWNLVMHVIAALDVNWGFSYRAVDLVVTVAVAVWLVVRWRRLDLAEASLLLAVLLFSWLVMSRGDYISYVGSLLGLPVIVVVVFGILYTLVSGAGFTTESSKRLPRESRTLMFIGYLLLSVTILHWLEAIHEPSIADLNSYAAFYFLGIPMTAWLLARRIVPRRSGADRGLSEAQAADLRGPTSTTPSSTLTS